MIYWTVSHGSGEYYLAPAYLMNWNSVYMRTDIEVIPIEIFYNEKTKTLLILFFFSSVFIFHTTKFSE